ncbi:MAG: T9SS type A sorting domain-containing protein, partial [Bacteroidota bacterium]
GISSDTAFSFSGGMGIDRKNWFLDNCPATGPDGVIIGDTLFSTFMSGAGGKSLVYFNKSSLSSMNGSTGIALTGTIAGLSQQNYPRLATDGKALAIAWKQIVNGNDQCVLRFTDNVANGLPSAYETVTPNNIINCDVAVSNGNIYVVWQDDNSGTVKYRKGTFSANTKVNELIVKQFSVYPNPAINELNIHFPSNDNYEVEITNALGETIFKTKNKNTIDISQLVNGIYFLKAREGNHIYFRKIIKQ